MGQSLKPQVNVYTIMFFCYLISYTCKIFLLQIKQIAPIKSKVISSKFTAAFVIVISSFLFIFLFIEGSALSVFFTLCKGIEVVVYSSTSSSSLYT